MRLPSGSATKANRPPGRGDVGMDNYAGTKPASAED
jgi:hypothetical protein